MAPKIFKETRSGISSLRVFAYLACGKPVIGSNIPGLGDMLEREGAGLSYPMGDSRAFGEAISRVLADKDQARAMGEKGRDFVLARHSWADSVRKLDTLFDMALWRKGKGSV